MTIDAPTITALGIALATLIASIAVAAQNKEIAALLAQRTAPQPETKGP